MESTKIKNNKDFNEIYRAIDCKFKKQICLVPESMRNACTKGKIACHSISKKAALTKISRRQHVYFIKFDKEDFFKETGIQKATTFNGFCRYHDNKIFEPIEKKNSTINSKEQYFLLSYRAFCLNLYKKKCSLLVKNYFLSRHHDFFSQDIIGLKTILKDYNFYKNLFEQALIDKEFDNFKHLVIELAEIPPVMGTGFYFPETNYKGEKINELYDSTIVQKAIALTCTASPDGKSGLIVLSAPKYSEELIKDLHINLRRQSGDKILEYIVNILFLYEENIVFSPNWWDRLPIDIQSKFKGAIQKNLPIEVMHNGYDNNHIKCKKYFNKVKLKNIHII